MQEPENKGSHFSSPETYCDGSPCAKDADWQKSEHSVLSRADRVYTPRLLAAGCHSHHDESSVMKQSHLVKRIDAACFASQLLSSSSTSVCQCQHGRWQASSRPGPVWELCKSSQASRIYSGGLPVAVVKLLASRGQQPCGRSRPSVRAPGCRIQWSDAYSTAEYPETKARNP